jgi:hypothetical protein
MFHIIAGSIGLFFCGVLLLWLIRVLELLTMYLATIRNHWMGTDTNDFVERATERVLRIVEEEYGKKHTPEEAKRMTFAEGMLNDVLREMGLDVTKFNVKGLLQAKKQEKGL